MSKVWNKVSRIGLRADETWTEFRHVILLNRLLFVMAVVMTLYIPVEALLNGVRIALVGVVTMIITFLATYIFHHFRKFTAGSYYLYTVGLSFIVAMGVAVGPTARNGVTLIALVVLSSAIFRSVKNRSIAFLLAVSAYLIQLYLFQWVDPIAEVPVVNQEIFSHIAVILTMVLCFFIGHHFVLISGEYQSVIEKQKAEIHEKHQEITDSIAYAKRIQSAMLPPDSIVRDALPACFIYYRPKDVVAGDFYWMEPIGDTVYFAAADCTGHGVPGAMVSVICVNGLNRAVREFELRLPGEILDKTRELVIKEFEKSEEDVKDGMDISLCALNTNTKEVQWAGAHNPLWIVRKGADEIEEIKADKQPVGKFEMARPFTTHSVKLNSEDTIYLFSDGYPDQFGGETGKKYKSGNFKRTLVRLSSLPISEQFKQLDEEFESWKGDLEQIDDVVVIGVQV